MSIASENAHWFEFFLGNLFPMSLGPMILGKNMHVFSKGTWLIARFCESYDAHSGYEFPWSPFRLIPFSCTATYHDYHHSHNVGCYSTFFTFWDTLLESNSDFYKY